MNSTSSLCHSAGLLVTRDSIGVQHVRLAPGVPARLRRFARFTREVLLAPDDAPDLVGARLVALDGVRPGSLSLVQAGLPLVYGWRDLVHVEWREEVPPRRERRALSASTQAALGHWRPADPDSTDLSRSLGRFLSQSETYRKLSAKERVRELERDALCWWYQCLPMALFFHVSGLQPLSAVSRLCLAREQTRMVPVVMSVEAIDDTMSDIESCAELLDAAAMSSGDDERPVVLRQALDRLVSAAGESDAAARRRWVVELLQLRFVALQAGPITSLLIAWLIDLCESGTVRSENPSKETPQRYFNKAAEPLLRRLANLPSAIAEWPVELLDAMYRELIEEELAVNPGGGSARTLASALTNFHAFLTDWFDVPPLRRRLHDAVPLIAVRANVVWSHEIDTAFGWINDVTNDRRLRTALRVVLCIAKEAPARASELLFLRLGNIKQCDGYVEIEVAPSLKFGRLKTRAAQRRLRITNPFAMALILSWKRERKAAGAGDGALLFADPVDARAVYRRHTLSTLVTALLRAASGDPAAVGHDLRHTVLSGLNGAVLETSSTVDINRLADNGTIAGHVTAATSLVDYTHLYEAALRHWLDAGMTTLIDFSSGESARLVDMSAVNLRQKASRNGSESGPYGWMLLRERDGFPAVPLASAAWTWTASSAPQPRAPGTIEFTVSISRLILGSVANRHGAKEVASHFMLDLGDVEHLQAAAIRTTHEVIRYTWPDKFDIRVGLPIGLEESLSLAGIDLAEAMAKKFNKLYEWSSAKQEPALLESAYASWRDCRFGNYLSLDKPARALGLLRLLATAGVDPRALRVCFRATADDAPADPRALEAATRDFVVAFGMKPRMWPVGPRDWTSSTYLQWDSEDCIEKPHASSGSVRGLDAWMLVIGSHFNRWKQAGGTHRDQTL